MNDSVLLIDSGNTLLKYRFLNGKGEILLEGFTPNQDIPDWASLLQNQVPELVFISKSGNLTFKPENIWPDSRISFLNGEAVKSISWAYPAVSQMGLDRIAALAAAKWLFPNSDLLVADAGTCLTVDFLRADGQHLGGFISPGFQMRLSAMHQKTSALPEISIEDSIHWGPGTNTKECMSAGSLSGIVAELEYHFSSSLLPDSSTKKMILTGGDAKHLAQHLKPHTFVVPDLVFQGMFAACKGLI